MSSQYGWIDFYMEFATKLLAFENRRDELIRKIQNVYKLIEINLPKLDWENVPTDIDPFTIFGLFNKRITEENRIRILEGLKKEFSVSAIIPNSFDGVPVLNNLSATYYAFEGQRESDDIDNIWKVFSAALRLAELDSSATREAFFTSYNKIIHQKGIRWNLSMGLFWIRPFRFVNLDSRSRWYFRHTDCISPVVIDYVKKIKDVPTAEDYLNLCDLFLEEFQDKDSRFKSFPELSSEAWRVSLEADANEDAGKDTPPNALGDPDDRKVHYWLYAPGEGASMWGDFYKRGIMGLSWYELGDLRGYVSKNEIADKMREIYGDSSSYKNSAHAVWQFAKEIKPGDVVFVKKGRSEILGRGVVRSDYEYDETSGEYPHIRKAEWTHKGSWHIDEMLAMKTLTDFTDYPNTVAKINSFFERENVGPDVEEPPLDLDSYTREDFLNEVYISKDDYDTMVDVLRDKKNIILQGAPGVGKTFVAKRLAYSVMGVKDVDRVMMVQFHQSYSYEDFIMGFRPTSSGYELKKGAFYNFCRRAADDNENDYFFIIDEINRGNLSKIFGELFMLVENDKRGSRYKLQLLYSDELFYIPENLYIIGMMNTADRSLAMMDYALRRRFAFIDLKPAFKSEQFKAYRRDLDDRRFDSLIQCIESLNERISADDSLGDGFCIGHSYFCNLNKEELTDKKLSNIVEFELIPMLKEYWFDEPGKVKEWSDNLRSAIK